MLRAQRTPPSGAEGRWDPASSGWLGSWLWLWISGSGCLCVVGCWSAMLDLGLAVMRGERERTSAHGLLWRCKVRATHECWVGDDGEEAIQS